MVWNRAISTVTTIHYITFGIIVIIQSDAFVILLPPS